MVASHDTLNGSSFLKTPEAFLCYKMRLLQDEVVQIGSLSCRLTTAYNTTLRQITLTLYAVSLVQTIRLAFGISKQ